MHDTHLTLFPPICRAGATALLCVLFLIPHALAQSKFSAAHETFAKKGSEGPEHLAVGLLFALFIAIAIALGILWHFRRVRKQRAAAHHRLSGDTKPLRRGRNV